MGRECAFAGIVALAIFAGTPAFAEDVASGPPVPLQPPALRPAEPQSSAGSSAEVPRYSVMIPPAQDDAPFAPPTPAPAPDSATSAAASSSPTTQWQPAQPRYAAMGAPEGVESVTVTGLRSSEDSGYRLDTGDRVRVTVFNESDLSGEFQIDSQGYVRLPLIGQVAAAGLSTFGLESRIAGALAGGGYLINPRVAVEVTTYRPFYIIGEVAKPGEYAYVNGMSAPNAVALAGGYTDRAVETEMWVRHQGETKEHEMPADETTRIRPGDVIRVGRTPYWSVITLLAPLISPFATAAYLLK